MTKWWIIRTNKRFEAERYRADSNEASLDVANDDIKWLQDKIRRMESVVEAARDTILRSRASEQNLGLIMHALREYEKGDNDMSNWKEYQQTSKSVIRRPKAKNHCQMKDCYILIKYKCTPQLEGASPIYVCERDMPVWRDKYYTIEHSTRIP